MDSILQYGDDEDEEMESGYDREALRPSLVQTTHNAMMCSLPLAVFSGVPSSSSSSSSSSSINPFQRKKVADTSQNLPISEMYAPIAGPHHPKKNPNNAGFGISKIEFTSVNDYTFREQHNSFAANGHAIDCSTGAVMGVPAPSRAASKTKGALTKRKRPTADDDDLGEELSGPWAEDKAESEAKQAKLASAAAAAAKEQEALPVEETYEETEYADNVHMQEPDEEAEKWEKVNERKMSYLLPPRPARGSAVEEAKSVFHGKELFDYQGRPWWQAPSGVRADGGDHACYVPKKCVKKLTGHTKGVQCVEYYPGTGHLLLSASLDGKCKIWDIMGDRNVRRTYHGHTEGVRSIHFNNTGSEFLSSGFDRLIRMWDVETGQAKGTFCNRKMGYQVKYYPIDNNVFLMAASDNRVYQWDARTGNVCQEYNYHLQPCNTVTFIDGGRKFVSTSDDKKVLVWEYDIPVPIKYIAEPGMHSIPAITVHPSGDFFAGSHQYPLSTSPNHTPSTPPITMSTYSIYTEASNSFNISLHPINSGQSLDNTIVVYACGEKVKQLKKRTFTGHNNSGYACQVNFSPNGQFLISGDGLGKLHVWDWKTGKVYRKFQAHENGPCIGAVWNPLLPNLIATCGWDGLIKLWD